MEDKDKIELNIGFFGGLLLFILAILAIVGLTIASPFIMIYKIVELFV